MRDCKNIAIRFKDEEELYRQFIKAKADYSQVAKPEGGKKRRSERRRGNKKGKIYLIPCIIGMKND